MKTQLKFLGIIMSSVLLSALIATAQQPTPALSPSIQMQSPAATQASPSPQASEQSGQQMQNMDKMAASMTQMADMCKMMMTKEMAGMHYKIAAGIAFGVVLFLDLLLLLILEMQWIAHWSRTLKRERR